MKKWFILAASISVVAASSLLAGEGGRPGEDREHFRGHGPKHRELLPPHVLDRLSLSAEQKSQYDRLNAQFMQERDQMFKSHQEQGGSLREEFKSARERGDEAKLEELREQRREKVEPFRQMRGKYMEQFRAILNADQIAKLDEAKRRMQERRAEFGERRGEFRERREGESPRRPRE